MIEVQTNAPEVARFFDAAASKALPLAESRALNRTSAKLRTRVIRRISAGTGVKQKQLRRRIKVISKATRQRPVTRLFSGFGKIKVAYLGPARELKGGGVSYAGGRGRRTDKNAFIAQMPSGHVGVFNRQGRSRLPIKEKAVDIELVTRAAMKEAQFASRKIYEEEFARDMQYRLTREAQKVGAR